MVNTPFLFLWIVVEFVLSASVGLLICVHFVRLCVCVHVMCHRVCVHAFASVCLCPYCASVCLRILSASPPPSSFLRQVIVFTTMAAIGRYHKIIHRIKHCS